MRFLLKKEQSIVDGFVGLAYIASFFSNPLEHYTKWREFFVGESKNTTEFYGQSAFTPLQNVLYERVKMLRPEPTL